MDKAQVVARLSKLNIISLDESALVTINNTGYYHSGNYVNLTAPQVATAYNMPFHSGAGMKVGIISFDGGFKQSDINLTFSSYQTSGLIPGSFTAPIINQILLNGATGQFGVNTNADAENALDIACVATLIPEATINIYINSSTNFISDIQSTIARAISDGCDVITMSWTFGEASGDFLSTQLQLANSNKIAFVNSSGDFGSDNSGVESVNYPTSSPYIIGVGGTHLTINTGTNTRLTETTEQNDSRFSFGVGSGGGFSTLFSAPSWQTGLSYQTYNSSTNIYGTLTPVTMRGVPDISGPMANSYVFYYNGNLVAAGGTSAATPVMAGMLARFKALTGKAFSSTEYNTLFYANLEAFYDITTGTNATYLPQGYAARVGWDPVTGVGAPDGYSLLNVIIGLRPNQGIEWPRLTGIRPSVGQAFPRPKIRI